MSKFEFVNSLGGTYTTEQFNKLQKKLCKYNFTKKELQAMSKNTLQQICRLAIPWSSWMFQKKSELIDNLMRLQDC